MPIPNDFLIGILKRTTQSAAFGRTPAHRRSIDRHPNESVVIESFVSLRLRKGSSQSPARQFRIEPFGEVGQSIVTEVPAHPQRSACLRTHQRLDRMKAGLAQ